MRMVSKSADSAMTGSNWEPSTRDVLPVRTRRFWFHSAKRLSTAWLLWAMAVMIGVHPLPTTFSSLALDSSRTVPHSAFCLVAAACNAVLPSGLCASRLGSCRGLVERCAALRVSGVDGVLSFLELDCEQPRGEAEDDAVDRVEALLLDPVPVSAVSDTPEFLSLGIATLLAKSKIKHISVGIRAVKRAAVVEATNPLPRQYSSCMVLQDSKVCFAVPAAEGNGGAETKSLTACRRAVARSLRISKPSIYSAGRDEERGATSGIVLPELQWWTDGIKNSKGGAGRFPAVGEDRAGHNQPSRKNDHLHECWKGTWGWTGQGRKRQRLASLNVQMNLCHKQGHARQRGPTGANGANGA